MIDAKKAENWDTERHFAEYEICEGDREKKLYSASKRSARHKNMNDDKKWEFIIYLQRNAKQ